MLYLMVKMFLYSWFVDKFDELITKVLSLFMLLPHICLVLHLVITLINPGFPRRPDHILNDTVDLGKKDEKQHVGNIP